MKKYNLYKIGDKISYLQIITNHIRRLFKLTDAAKKT